MRCPYCGSEQASTSCAFCRAAIPSAATYSPRIITGHYRQGCRHTEEPALWRIPRHLTSPLDKGGIRCAIIHASHNILGIV
jgi:hypothetical protein